LILTPIAGAEAGGQHIVQLDTNLPPADLSQNPPTTPAVIPQSNEILPVGLNVNGRNVLPSMNVRGREDGAKAVDLDLWLVPFDEIITALAFKVQEAADGQLEISSPLFKFQLPANKLVQDPKLGRAIALRDLSAIPGIKVKFDINNYAIDLLIPSLDRESNPSINEEPVLLDGLPIAKPAGWGLGAVQERINLSGQNGNSGSLQGELKAIGNIFDANWYLRLDQSQFDQPQNWNITDGVIIRQRPQNDLVLGSQLPFWRRQNNDSQIVGSYWGGTSVWRQGFTPPVQLFGSDFLINERLQAARIGRSIAGQAAPGTLVQLIRGSQLQILQEVLVDSSGLYRFDNVVVGNGVDNTFGQDYQVLLYPNGQRTTNPEIRLAQFVTTPGQIPAGASALVVSAGANRVAAGNFGNFDAVQGGVLYRRGINESLTVSVGTAFDQELRGVGELFWQPSNTPLQVALSATTGEKWDILGRLDYRPSEEFVLTGNTDTLSTRTQAKWQLSPSFAALSNYDSRRGLSVGGQYRVKNSLFSSTSLRAEVDDQARLKFSANQRLDNWQFSLQSNEVSATTQVSYDLGGNSRKIDTGNELVAIYQTNSSTIPGINVNPYSTSLVWRYRSPNQAADGQPLWLSELGYSFNGLGSGLVAAVDLNLIPGLRLRQWSR
jgi:hypothetical protein